MSRLDAFCIATRKETNDDVEAVPCDVGAGRGALYKLAVHKDGSPGTLALITDQIISPDGILLDSSGTLYAAQPFANAISMVSPAGNITTVAAGNPLSMPASLSIQGKTTYNTNLAFGAVPDAGPPGVDPVDLSPRHR